MADFISKEFKLTALIDDQEKEELCFLTMEIRWRVKK